MTLKKTAKPSTARRKTGRRRKTGDGRGHHTKLTSVVFNAVVEAVRAGNYLQAAAGAGGVSVNTVSEWIRRGENHHKRKSIPLYARFARALREAEAEAELQAVKILSENLTGYSAQVKEVSEEIDNQGVVTGRRSKITERTVRDPRSAIEFLKRRFPERWGDREKHRQDHEHRHEHVVMSAEDRAIASRIASARLRRASPN